MFTQMELNTALLVVVIMVTDGNDASSHRFKRHVAVRIIWCNWCSTWTTHNCGGDGGKTRIAPIITSDTASFQSLKDDSVDVGLQSSQMNSTSGSFDTAIAAALVPYSTTTVEINTRLNSQSFILGYQAGTSSEGSAIAIGEYACALSQNSEAAAVGALACTGVQGLRSIAIVN